MHLINTSFQRPDTSVVRALSEYSVALIGDAMGRHGIMQSAIKPVWAGAQVAGPALTVETYPCDNLMLHVALRHAQPADVLVVDGGGYMEGGLWGELMSLEAKSARVSGLIVDGAVRDTAQMMELRFPVWARAVSARGTLKNGEGSVGVSIACGGQVVHPGDIVIGDSNGVAVIPREKAEYILERVRQQARTEDVIRQRMANGERLYEILDLNADICNRSLP